jgi:hypothetical protein
MAKVKITIGDWSEDGHNQSEDFVFEVNKSVIEIQNAYKASCKLTGLIFDSNENHTNIKDLDWKHPEFEKRQVFVEYEQNTLSDFAKNIISNHGLKLPTGEPENFCYFMFEFIKLSLPDLTFEEASFKKSELKLITPINGWWSKNCNETWGYGLFE